MQILLTDETNQQPSKTARFFVYGGLIFPLDNLPKLIADIKAIRADLAYKPSETFKFEKTSIPKRFLTDMPRIWKGRHDVVLACAAAKAQFVTCICHHSIAEGARKGGKYLTMGANEVLKTFHDQLESANDFGLCLMDNLSIEKPFQYLKEKQQRGLVYEAVGKPDRPLHRILMYGLTSVDACHANSAVDIVLGLFRTCINAPRSEEFARKLMADVVSLIKHTVSGEVVNVQGLKFRPMDFNLKFKAEYDWLNQHIAGLIAGGPLPKPLPDN